MLISFAAGKSNLRFFFPAAKFVGAFRLLCTIRAEVVWRLFQEMVMKGPNVLVIDRTKPFDVKKFIAEDWDVVEEDERGLALTEIDFSNVSFEHCLKDGEEVITGEEKLKRLKTTTAIRLGAKIGQTLYEEKEQTTLRFLYDTYGITWFELAGTVLRYSDGRPFFLYLHRSDDGSWHWYFLLLAYLRYHAGVSPVLESTSK